MSFSVVIASHGKDEWEQLALTRALPSAKEQGCEVLIGHDSHGTRASVRNALTEKATGDWIITLDADDELAPGYVTAMEERAVSIDWWLLTPMIQYVKHGRVRKPKFMPEVDLAQGNWMVVGTAVPRALLLEVGGWRTFTHDGVLNQWDDWDLWIRCVKAGAGVVKVPDAVYVAHEDNLSPHRERSPATTQAWLRQIREANGIGG
jgi:glycosyltransferase involved in cell wall biosynthesis